MYIGSFAVFEQMFGIAALHPLIFWTLPGDSQAGMLESIAIEKSVKRPYKKIHNTFSFRNSFPLKTETGARLLTGTYLL